MKFKYSSTVVPKGTVIASKATMFSKAERDNLIGNCRDVTRSTPLVEIILALFRGVG